MTKGKAFFSGPHYQNYPTLTAYTFKYNNYSDNYYREKNNPNNTILIQVPIGTYMSSCTGGGDSGCNPRYSSIISHFYCPLGTKDVYQAKNGIWYCIK